MRKLVFVLCLVVAMPVYAMAGSDIIATYKYKDGNMMTLCTRDADHVRMDTSPTSYILLKNDKVYSVNRDDDGNWNVIDMDQMKSAGGGLTSMFGGGGSAPEYDVRYEKTGKTEKIAGYSGTVYNAVVFEDGKIVSRDEIVLCTHSNLKRLTEGWVAIAEKMANNTNKGFDDSLEEARKMGYGGMLRYGNDMRLSNIQVKNFNSSYYELPSGSQQVQMKQPPQQAEGSDMGLGDDASEIGQDAKQATKDEIKGAIRDTISDLFN